MSRREISLADCCDLITDGDHQPPPKSDSGVPFITISDFTPYNTLSSERGIYVPETYYDSLPENRKARKGDILYSVVGSFGIPILLRDHTAIAFQRHIALLRPKSTLDTEYLYYAMLSREFYQQADAVALGAAQRTISLSSLRNMKLSVPSIEEQRKVAHVLSAYDTLIENNRKQIKLLEEAARRLYKEWFVDLRFPGHEHTPIVNGIPEGWRRGELSSIASFVRGKTITQAKTLPGCIPVVAGGLTPAYYHNTANTRPPVITVSASGANAGYVALYHTPIWASDCSFIDSTKSEHLYYLYCLLKEHQAEINNFRKGSAQPHVHPNQINGLQLLVPHMKFIRQFEQSTAALFGKIRTLSTQNELLTEARDRLLPKLMSGEIAIK